ncbi:hypothetical protein [Mariniflexile maritimum]|uniref:hypothetical protein n=1 Tax=Mariniflexile maritimum TaxID=2682493 RepID=UPI0012F64203|nr:hypothetical protein [Mariniflexile maritimum]
MMLSTLFLSAFMMLSCSNQEPISQQDVTSQDALAAMATKKMVTQNYDYLNGIELYYSGAEAEIKRLKLEKTKLVAELENGNKKVLERIETIQVQIEKLVRFNAYLISKKPVLGPGGPLPPPQPCFDSKESNCNPKRKLSSKTFIVLGKELSVSNVIIKNMKNQLVDAKFQHVEDPLNQNALQLTSDFKGEGTMYTTLKTDVVGEITIPTPVVGL